LILSTSNFTRKRIHATYRCRKRKSPRNFPFSPRRDRSNSCQLMTRLT